MLPRISGPDLIDIYCDPVQITRNSRPYLRLNAQIVSKSQLAGVHLAIVGFMVVAAEVK